MSLYLTPETAARAADRIRPLILERIGSTEVGERKTFCYVVLNPTDGSILYQETLGEKDKSKWGHNYEDIALRKARQSWRTGLTGSQLRSSPWLYEDGDVPFAGGVVEFRLAVGGSGFQGALDESTDWLIFNAMSEAAVVGFDNRPADIDRLGTGEDGMKCPNCDSTNLVSVGLDTTEYRCMNCGTMGEALEFSEPIHPPSH